MLRMFVDGKIDPWVAEGMGGAPITIGLWTIDLHRFRRR